jgi:serine/threonine protein kinase
VEVFHAGEERGLLYLTMRFVAGSDLRRMLGADTRLEPCRAISIVADVASALDEAHGLGLVHRDVKPENVLVARRSGREHAFLTDFGITKRTADEPLTRTGVAIGTVDYTAPEQARGTEVDARADVYSLGCLLFRMLTGRVPFPDGTELDKLFAHVHKPPPELLAIAPDLPRRLQDVLEGALAKDPGDRPSSAGEFDRRRSGRAHELTPIPRRKTLNSAIAEAT